jgi:hypothetical protein
MRFIGVFLLNCRLWQASWLVVVLTSLAISSRCAATGQLAANMPRQVLAVSTDQLRQSLMTDGDQEHSIRYASLRHSPISGSCSTAGGVGLAFKSTRLSAKYRVSRRGEEPWRITSWGHLPAMLSGLAAPAGPVSKSLSVLPAEYALLRRLKV